MGTGAGSKKRGQVRSPVSSSDTPFPRDGASSLSTLLTDTNLPSPLPFQASSPGGSIELASPKPTDANRTSGPGLPEGSKSTRINIEDLTPVPKKNAPPPCPHLLEAPVTQKVSDLIFVEDYCGKVSSWKSQSPLLEYCYKVIVSLSKIQKKVIPSLSKIQTEEKNQESKEIEVFFTNLKRGTLDLTLPSSPKSATGSNNSVSLETMKAYEKAATEKRASNFTALKQWHKQAVSLEEGSQARTVWEKTAAKVLKLVREALRSRDKKQIQCCHLRLYFLSFLLETCENRSIDTGDASTYVSMLKNDKDKSYLSFDIPQAFSHFQVSPRMEVKLEVFNPRIVSMEKCCKAFCESELAIIIESSHFIGASNRSFAAHFLDSFSRFSLLKPTKCHLSPKHQKIAKWFFDKLIIPLFRSLALLVPMGKLLGTAMANHAQENINNNTPRSLSSLGESMLVALGPTLLQAISYMLEGSQHNQRWTWKGLFYSFISEYMHNTTTAHCAGIIYSGTSTEQVTVAQQVLEAIKTQIRAYCYTTAAFTMVREAQKQGFGYRLTKAFNLPRDVTRGITKGFEFALENFSGPLIGLLFAGVVNYPLDKLNSSFLSAIYRSRPNVPIPHETGLSLRWDTFGGNAWWTIIFGGAMVPWGVRQLILRGGAWFRERNEERSLIDGSGSNYGALENQENKEDIFKKPLVPSPKGKISSTDYLWALAFSALVAIFFVGFWE